MSGQLHILSIGPGATIQDLGRPGLIAQGLSQGGAMDRLAVLEATALLGEADPVAGLEMVGSGGVFRVDQPMRFALTGAPMRSEIDGAEIRWNASHYLLPGQKLKIWGAKTGVYGYLTPAGGVLNEPWQGSRSTHLSAGVGGLLARGDELPVGSGDLTVPSQFLVPEDRFSGGQVRLLPGPQTGLFPEEMLSGLTMNTYRRGPQGNRQGIRLDGAAIPLPEAAKGLVSDFILAGDVQIAGDGAPIVLMAECQTIGGYPRIGTILPSDLPKVAQAQIGAVLQFQFVEHGVDSEVSEAETLARLRKDVHPLIRDPRAMGDLLSYELISGATPGDDLEGK